MATAQSGSDLVLIGLLWRSGAHYARAETRSQGRVKQGGGKAPWVVSRSALKAYCDELVRSGL